MSSKIVVKFKFGFLVATILFLIISLFFASPAHGANGVNIGEIVDLGGISIGDAFGNFGEFATALVMVGLFAAALIFLAMLIWGGFRYMSAGGDVDNTKAARSTLTNAGAGLVIVVASFVVVQIISGVVGTGGGPIDNGSDSSAREDIEDTKEASKDAAQVLGISADNPYVTSEYKIEYRPKSSTFVVVDSSATSIEKWRLIKKDSEKVFVDNKDVDLCSVYLFWSVPTNIKPKLQQGDTIPTGCSSP